MSNQTGSIAIDRALLSGPGAALTFTGILVLVASAVAHATHAHLAAALVFGLGMATLRILANHDLSVRGTPWRGIVKLTDLLSLAALAVATFAPLFIVATGGHPGWDVPVLAGVLAIWWTVLDRIIADYRRIRIVLVVIALAWSPIVFLHPSVRQIAYVVAAFTLVAIGFCVWSLRTAMLRVPRYYRLIDLEEAPAERSA